MIAVDTSALCAILFGEPHSEIYDDALFAADAIAISAPTAFEFLMVAEGRRNFFVRQQAERLLDIPRMTIMPWMEEYVAIADDAFRRYGKGRGHPAQLNFGDCMSYALAKALDVPLLYKGGHFARTDIAAAV
jgi:ribonuclease VapC